MVEYFLGIIFAIAGISTLVTEFIKRLVKTDKKWINDLISWIVAIALTFAAWAIGYTPAMSQPEWLFVLIEGVLVAFASTGIYDKSFIKKILDWIFSWINGEKWYTQIK